jgi:hypothetical protein
LLFAYRKGGNDRPSCFLRHHRDEAEGADSIPLTTLLAGIRAPIFCSLAVACAVLRPAEEARTPHRGSDRGLWRLPSCGPVSPPRERIPAVSPHLVSESLRIDQTCIELAADPVFVHWSVPMKTISWRRSPNGRRERARQGKERLVLWPAVARGCGPPRSRPARSQDRSGLVTKLGGRIIIGEQVGRADHRDHSIEACYIRKASAVFVREFERGGYRKWLGDTCRFYQQVVGATSASCRTSFSTSCTGCSRRSPGSSPQAVPPSAIDLRHPARFVSTWLEQGRIASAEKSREDGDRQLLIHQCLIWTCVCCLLSR